jgi:long-chain acyl-CoA synthetase
MSARPQPWEKSYPTGLAWNAPIATSTLGALVDRAAGFGPRTALEYRGHEILYAELGRAVDRMAGALLARGIGPGQGVALYLPNTPCHPIAFFAVAKTGARIVSLSPMDAERELALKLSDSGARTLVTTNLGSLPALAAKLLAQGLVDFVIVGDESLWPPAETAPLPPGDKRIVAWADFVAAPAPAAWPRIDASDVALIQYTGGTTGLPKGTMLTHANLTAAVSIYQLWSDSQGRLRPGEDRVVCVLPLFHIYAITAVLLYNIKAGNRILLRERFSADGVLRDIEQKRATSIPGVPTMWIALASVPGVEQHDFSSLRAIYSGAAPLPVEVEQKIGRLTGLRLGGGWGMTETAPAGTGMPLPCDRAGTIGLPLPGITIEIVSLDDPRRVLPPGEIGELRIKGPNVTQGYWNRPRESQSPFIDGFLLTGDVGRMDEDGFLYLVDRRSDMIISSGFNVYPSAVENALYEHPDVEEAVALGVPDPYRGEAVKVFMKLRPGARPFTLESLKAFLADKLGRHEMPASLEFRPSLPRTAVGKLSRKMLADEQRQALAAAP